MDMDMEVAAMVVGEAEEVVTMEVEAGEEVVGMVGGKVVGEAEEVAGGKAVEAGGKIVVEKTKAICLHQSQNTTL
ncbi:unnamed protein product [Malus baccata var. baccata]